jgi:micrococcal nuclease
VIRRLAAVLAVAFVLTVAGCAGGGPVVDGGDESRATVTRVVDGDTVEVRFADGTEETVRLLGVDTPEVRGDTDPAEFEGVPETAAGRDWLRRWAERASAYAVDRLAGKRVRVVTDPTADRRGSYGRLLAYVYVGDKQESFNLALLEKGYARLYDTSFSERDRFAAAEASAREAGVGLWGFSDATTPATVAVADGGVALTLVEIRADAPGNDNENLNGEFLVFGNAGSDPIALGGWRVVDAAGHEYVFPDGTTLAPNATLTLHTGAGTDGDGDLYWNESGAVWNNGGDTVTVRDVNGTVVLRTEY